MVLVVQLLHNSLKSWQEGDTQVTVLQKDPPALGSAVLELDLGLLGLTLTE
jgi:hypothetical protein